MRIANIDGCVWWNSLVRQPPLVVFIGTRIERFKSCLGRGRGHVVGRRGDNRWSIEGRYLRAL